MSGARASAAKIGGLPAACAALLLGACAANAPAPVIDLSAGAPPAAPKPVEPPRETGDGQYRVVAGDTLYAIAFKHGLDFRDVAAWNRIAAPYRIYAGQELRLRPPDRASRPTVAAAAPTRPAVAVAPPSASPASPPPPGAPQKPAAAMFEDVPAEPAVAAAQAPAPVQPTAPKNGAAAAVDKPPPPASVEARPPDSTGQPARAPAADSVAIGANGIAWRWPGKGALVGTYVAGDQTRQGIDIAGQSGDPVLAAADGEVVYSGNGLLGYGELIIIKHNATYLSAYGHNRKRLVQEGQKIKGGQQIAEMGSSASSRDELHFEIRKNGKPVNPLDYLPAR